MHANWTSHPHCHFFDDVHSNQWLSMCIPCRDGWLLVDVTIAMPSSIALQSQAQKIKQDAQKIVAEARKAAEEARRQAEELRREELLARQTSDKLMAEVAASEKRKSKRKSKSRAPSSSRTQEEKELDDRINQARNK